MMEVALYKPIVARTPDKIILRSIVVLRFTFPFHLLNKTNNKYYYGWLN